MPDAVARPRLEFDPAKEFVLVSPGAQLEAPAETDTASAPRGLFFPAGLDLLLRIDWVHPRTEIPPGARAAVGELRRNGVTVIPQTSKTEVELGNPLVGLGDAPNDAGFLALCDVAVLVPRASGEVDPDLFAAIPTGRIGPFPAGRGWAAAVSDLLEEAIR